MILKHLRVRVRAVRVRAAVIEYLLCIVRQSIKYCSMKSGQRIMPKQTQTINNKREGWNRGRRFNRAFHSMSQKSNMVIAK